MRREKQAPCQEPNAGLDPQTPGSRPGPKAGAKPLSHPGIPWKLLDFKVNIIFMENMLANFHVLIQNTSIETTCYS